MIVINDTCANSAVGCTSCNRERAMMESALRDRDVRLRRMMRRLAVDPLEFAYARLGAEFEEARKACLTCENAAQCRLWLAGASAEAPLFCINLSRFERFSVH